MNEKINKIVDAVKGAAGEISDKAEITKEIVRLNYARSKTEQNIVEAYAELGKVLYESGVIPECVESDEMDCICDEIDALMDQLKDIKDSINLIKGRVECNVCGKISPEDFQFCPECGSPLVSQLFEEEIEEELPECCDCEECEDSEEKEEE